MATATKRTKPKTQNYGDLTREELYEIAQERDIDGRSEMDKDELAAALELDDVGPDAVDYILRQHTEVRELFDEFDELSSRPSQRKTDVVRSVITLLSKHAAIEEQIFYPAVRREIPDIDEDVNEDLEEHHLVEVALLELDRMDPSDERHDAKFHVMVENVRHHMEEEEEDLLPRIREEMDERQRRELGGQLRTAWDAAPERPHPVAPDTPPGNVIAGIPAAITDRVINLVRFGMKAIRRRS